MAWSPVALKLFQKPYSQLPPIFAIQRNPSPERETDINHLFSNSGSSNETITYKGKGKEVIKVKLVAPDDAADQTDDTELTSQSEEASTSRSPSETAGPRKRRRALLCLPPWLRAAGSASSAIPHPGRPFTDTLPRTIQHIEAQLSSVNADPDCILRTKKFVSEIGPAAQLLGETLSSTDLEDLEDTLRAMQREKMLSVSKAAFENETNATQRLDQRREIQRRRQLDALLGVVTPAQDGDDDVERLQGIDSSQWRQKKHVLGRVAAEVGKGMMDQIKQVRMDVLARDMEAKQAGEDANIASPSPSPEQKSASSPRHTKRTAAEMLADKLSIKRAASQPGEPRLRLCHVRMYHSLFQLFRFPRVTSPDDMSLDTIELLSHTITMLSDPWNAVWRKPSRRASSKGQAASKDDAAKSSQEDESSSDSDSDSESESESGAVDKSELRCICHRSKGLNIASFCKRIYPKSPRRARKEATRAVRSRGKKPSHLRIELVLGKGCFGEHCKIL